MAINTQMVFHTVLLSAASQPIRFFIHILTYFLIICHLNNTIFCKLCQYFFLNIYFFSQKAQLTLCFLTISIQTLKKLFCLFKGLVGAGHAALGDGASSAAFSGEGGEILPH